MTIETRARPLSFTYRREADPSELAIISRAREAHSRDMKGEIGEIGSHLVIGAASLILVGPLVFLLVLLTEWAFNMRLVSDTGGAIAAIGWVLLWTLRGFWQVASIRRRHTGAFVALDEDVEGNEVTEESWRFIEAIGFQEAETLPVLYAMRADDGSVVMLDEDSLNPAIRRDMRQNGSLAPADAVLVRAPRSHLLISENYSGPCVPLNTIHRLTVPHNKRPAHGSVLPIGWSEVVRELAKA